jgi:hypothetical protein
MLLSPMVLGTLQEGEEGSSELFRFILIADAHIGYIGEQGSDYLSWLLTAAYNAIEPEFIVNAGDLTDSSNGLPIPAGPYREEWEEYRSITDGAGMNPEIYYDLPGNHDQYNDADLSYYLRYSIQGEATGEKQQTWSLGFEGKKYQFVSICTAGNDGATWPIDNAGLDPEELSWIRERIDPCSEIIFFFGHHPLESWEYGREEFESILMGCNSIYCYGHTHSYSLSYLEDTMLVNAASIGKSDHDHYVVIRAFSNGEISVVPYDVYQIPEFIGGITVGDLFYEDGGTPEARAKGEVVKIRRGSAITIKVDCGYRDVWDLWGGATTFRFQSGSAEGWCDWPEKFSVERGLNDIKGFDDSSHWSLCHTFAPEEEGTYCFRISVEGKYGEYGEAMGSIRVIFAD